MAIWENRDTALNAISRAGNGPRIDDLSCDEGEGRRRRNRASLSPAGLFYEFPMTYTDLQSLARSLNDLRGRRFGPL